MMMVSTKGRYALRVMIDLAEQNKNQYIPLKDIAARQDISRKYLESIMVILSKAGLVDGQHGKGGGYKLNRLPEQYTIADILNLTENSLAPVSCLTGDTNTCEQAAKCRTLPMWTELYKLINNYFENITLADLVQTDTADDYVI